MNDFPATRSKEAMFVMVGVARMIQAGLVIPDVAARLEKIGYSSEDALALAQDGAQTAREYAAKIPAGRVPGAPRVFLSHSHVDRAQASYVDLVLERNGVQTYLDQHQIAAGQNLSARLMVGLFWCDVLLLFWSRNAARSEYVAWEWLRAQTLMKTIVAYRLDGTKLPKALSGLVFIESADDQAHGHARLLRSILGQDWKPADPATLFPGVWEAEVNVMGFGEAEYELQLRANGQIIGKGHMKSSGLFGNALRDVGMAHLGGLDIPVNGSWSYDDRQKILELDLTAAFMGQQNRDVVHVQTARNENGWLTGTTLGGMPWRLRRRP